MDLSEYLIKQFASGVEYKDAVELCKALYSSLDYLPSFVEKEKLSMGVIADSFSSLGKKGLIKNYSADTALLSGASYHSCEDKGHWIEVQASILKLGAPYDADRVKNLLSTEAPSAHDFS